MYKNYRDKALLALPHLIRAAQLRKTLTYGEIGKIVGLHPRNVRHVAGCIRDEICRLQGLPLLNSLIVTKREGIPGDSFLPGGAAANDEERRQQFESFRDQVFEFTGWDDLLAELKLEPLETTIEDLQAEAQTYNEMLSRRPGGGEAERHRELKEYISQHPSTLDLPSSSKSHLEFTFLSGDRVDVAFDCDPLGWAVVEVKVGIRGELVKGIYQAIKYRALAEAQMNDRVLAYLVAYNIPRDIMELAKHHQIRTKIIGRGVVSQNE